MAVALFIVAAATSHSQPAAHSYWWSCREPERVHCIAHEMKKHHRTPVGFWQSCKQRCTVFPYFHRHVKPIVRPAYRQATRAVRTLSLWTTYYCLSGVTASGRMAGPGIVASYILPWGAHVRDLTTGWEGYVWDHPDALTQADEWLPCGQNFPTGRHQWEVIG